MSVQNVLIKPQLVYLGKNQAQVQKITCVADVALSLQNKYFVFHDAAGAKRYAWFNVATAGVDPAPVGGWTGHVVAIASGATASQVASALQSVLDAVTGFDASVSGFVVTLTHTANGYAQPARDVDTSFAFEVSQFGMTEIEAGCIQGDLELGGMEIQKTQILCHSTGLTVQDEKISGYSNPELTMVFQETDKESLKRIFAGYLGNGSLTPVGADKEEIFGYGTANLGKANPKMLVRMHEVGKDASDKTNDLNFWSAELSVESLNWSGESVSTVPVMMKIYPDETKPKGIEFFMIGDAEKAGF